MYIHNKTKKKVSRKALVFLISVIVVLVVLLTGLIMVLTKGKQIEDTLVPMPFTSDSEYSQVGSNVVYLSDTLLTSVDPSGKRVWQCSLYAAGLRIEANDHVIAAIGDDAIQCVDATGAQLFTTRIDGNIESARVGINKVAVYVRQTLENNQPSYILIFDLSGNNLYQITVTDKYILDYGFDTQGDQLYVLELDAAGSVPVSRISTYRPETQAMTGIKELKDQLVDGVKIIGKDIYAMGTHRLTIYPAANTGNSRDLLTYGWMVKDISMVGDSKFIYVPSSEAPYDIARIIRASGGETKINLPPHVSWVVMGTDKIYCFANTSFFVYTGDGKYLRSYDLPFESSEVLRAMPGYVFISQGSSVYLMPLP